MADSPRKETPPPADSAPRILRFLVRVWGVVAGLCEYINVQFLKNFPFSELLPLVITPFLF